MNLLCMNHRANLGHLKVLSGFLLELRSRARVDYIIKPSQSPLMAPKMPIHRVVSLNCKSGGLP